MSTDLIGWQTLKKTNIRKALDIDQAHQEAIESNIVELRAYLELMEEGFTKEITLKSLDIVSGYFARKRTQIIWINALKEGLMEIEQRLDSF